MLYVNINAKWVICDNVKNIKISIYLEVWIEHKITLNLVNKGEFRVEIKIIMCSFDNVYSSGY